MAENKNHILENSDIDKLENDEIIKDEIDGAPAPSPSEENVEQSDNDKESDDKESDDEKESDDDKEIDIDDIDENTDYDEIEEIKKELDQDKNEDSASEAYEEELENKFDTLIELLDDKKYTEFMQGLEELNPVDAADFFSELPSQRIPAVFKLLKKDTAAEVFAELESDVQHKIITAMTDRELSIIIEELSVDDAVDMLEELPANIVRRVLQTATPETRAEINKFLAYPDDSAGSVMTAEFIDLRAEMTCSEAIEHIRITGIDKETVYYAYVTDNRRVLQGIISFKDLLYADPNSLIADVMSDQIICASTLDDQETVADTISKYDLLALPIVDKENRLVGIVTVDDAMDVITEEATEDIEMLAGMAPTDKPYMKTGVFETWRKRFPWLLIIMISAIFTGMIMAKYEAALGTYAILAVFVPMLMNTGGNAGSQASVAIIRALSLDEISMGDIFKIIWKEFRVSLLCGACISVACFIKTMLVDFKLDFTWENVEVALIVSVTVICAIVIAKLIGACLPIGAKRIGLDPAVMATPLIATIVDTVTLIVYFAIASKILGF